MQLAGGLGRRANEHLGRQTWEGGGCCLDSASSWGGERRMLGICSVGFCDTALLTLHFQRFLGYPILDNRSPLVLDWCRPVPPSPCKFLYSLCPSASINTLLPTSFSFPAFLVGTTSLECCKSHSRPRSVQEKRVATPKKIPGFHSCSL